MKTLQVMKIVPEDQIKEETHLKRRSKMQKQNWRL